MTPTENGEPVLSLRDVVCVLGERERFTLLVEAFDVVRGEAIALAGPSGSGKSTIMNLLALARRPARVGQFHFFRRHGQGYDIGALWEGRDDDGLTAIWPAPRLCPAAGGPPARSFGLRQNIALSDSRSWARSIGSGSRMSPGGWKSPSCCIARRRLFPSVSVSGRHLRAPSFTGPISCWRMSRPREARISLIAAEILGLLVEQCVKEATTVVVATHDPELAARKGFEIVTVDSAAGAEQAESSVLSRIVLTGRAS